MPHYFFHIRMADGVVQDDEGREMPDLDAARREAIQSARDITNAQNQARLPGRAQAIEVVDEHGDVVLTVPCAPTHLH